MIADIASDKVIDQAYLWLCKARNGSHYNDDVWHLRFHWQAIKADIQQQLLNGEYYFSPCKALKIKSESIGVWQAQDALVLKAVAIVLTVSPSSPML